MLLFHNRGVFQRFVDELRHTYGTVESLNEAWGLVYWSHKLTTWADLWAPDGNYQPQYDLAWRTFQAKLTTEFIAWQAGIVREYARDDQFVTTCIAYERPTVDDANLTRALDVTAGNPYYAMQDALTVPTTAVKPQGWTTTGTWSLFLSADRMYASKQAPFLITETNAGAIGGSATNFPAYAGQWRQAAWAFVARGAEMIEYWHWHTNHFGTETYWVGILPHDQQPGRVYAELSRARRRLREGGFVAWSGWSPTRRSVRLFGAIQVGPGLPGRLRPARQAPSCPRWPMSTSAPTTGSSRRSTAAPSRPECRSRLLHDNQIVGPDGDLDPAQVAADLPVLIVPGLLVADDALLMWLREVRGRRRTPGARSADRVRR